MNFFEEVLLMEWASLKHLGKEIAQAWYEPDGERLTLVCRVPRTAFDDADAEQRVTIEILLNAAAVATDEVESWRIGDASASGFDELTQPLPPPPPDATHLTVRVHLKPPTPSTSRDDGGSAEVSQEQWQALEICWRAILGLEASIDTSRMSMDGVRSEMENEFRKSMSVEEKLHALQSDVAQWNKAKNRVHYALPKVKEFIHRATWAVATPERKRLEEIYRDHIEPRIPLPDVDQVREQLQHLQKDRQVLFAQGNSVYQECRGIIGEIQRAFSALQSNAANRAREKRSAKREKGKFY